MVGNGGAWWKPFAPPCSKMRRIFLVTTPESFALKSPDEPLARLRSLSPGLELAAIMLNRAVQAPGIAQFAARSSRRPGLRVNFWAANFPGSRFTPPKMPALRSWALA